MRAALVASLLASLLAMAGCRSDTNETPNPAPDIGPGGDGPTKPPDAGLTDTFVSPDLLPDPDLSLLPDTSQPPPPDASLPRDFTIFTDSGPKPDAQGCAPTHDRCTAAKTLTWSGSAIVENGDTTCAEDDLDFTSGACGGELVDGTAGADLFYKVTLPAGSYQVTLSASGWDPALYVINACNTGSCVVASDNLNVGVPEQVSVTVAASTTLLIGVDAFDDANYGTFSLTIELGGSPPADAGPAPDSTVDAGPAPDSTVDAGPADSTPGPDVGPVPDSAGAGNIIITELLFNPTASGDTEGEWLELHNAGAAPVNLKDWRIEDQPGTAQNSHTIASDLIVPAGGYVVLGHNADTATNGGAPVDYAYGAEFTLANTADEVFLFDPAGTLVDKVEYDKGAGWTIPDGASLSLQNPALDNNLPASWCTEAAAWSGSAGDKGTPGAPSGC